MSSAQTAQPQPTAAADTTAAAPIAAPVVGGSPSLTVVPGLPSAAQTDAYNATRIPLVSLALTAAATSDASTSSTNAASPRAASSVQPVVKGGVCQSIILQPAPAARAKTSITSITNTSSASQPVATITLTYPGGTAGQRVWVQALRGGGTLTATDDAGKVYDGSRGFFLTLDAGGTATFSYQAPNASGTYHVLTRYTNVTTAFPFLVPDPVP